MQNKNALKITQAAMIAAVYVVLTIMVNAFGMASGPVQIRLSEALTILPYFTPAAVPGLFIGCLISNLITGCLPWDVVLGSIATLLGALGTRALRKYKWLAPLPPIVSNTLIIPLVLHYIYNAPGALPFYAGTVFVGELISAGALGMVLLFTLSPYRERLFK